MKKECRYNVDTSCVIELGKRMVIIDDDGNCESFEKGTYDWVIDPSGDGEVFDNITCPQCFVEGDNSSLQGGDGLFYDGTCETLKCPECGKAFQATVLIIDGEAKFGSESLHAVMDED